MKQFQAILNFLDELYTVNNNNANFENYRILWKFSRWYWLITKFVFIVFGASFSMVIISPIPIYFITGNLEPILPVHIPLVDTKNISGYMIHSCYMFFLLTSAYCGTVSAELFLTSLTLHISPMVSIFDQAIKVLNEATTGSRKEAIKNSTWLHKSVRNIIFMHKHMYL